MCVWLWWWWEHMNRFPLTFQKKSFQNLFRHHHQNCQLFFIKKRLQAEKCWHSKKNKVKENMYGKKLLTDFGSWWLWCACVCKDKGENKMRTKEKFINFKIFIKKRKKNRQPWCQTRQTKHQNEEKNANESTSKQKKKKKFSFPWTNCWQSNGSILGKKLKI